VVEITLPCPFTTELADSKLTFASNPSYTFRILPIPLLKADDLVTREALELALLVVQKRLGCVLDADEQLAVKQPSPDECRRTSASGCGT
jgi:hypothetical protein